MFYLVKRVKYLAPWLALVFVVNTNTAELKKKKKKKKKKKIRINTFLWTIDSNFHIHLHWDQNIAQASQLQPIVISSFGRVIFDLVIAHL